jgi:hypothetical protein
VLSSWPFGPIASRLRRCDRSSISRCPAECGHHARYDKQHRPVHRSSGADEGDNWLRRFPQSRFPASEKFDQIPCSPALRRWREPAAIDDPCMEAAVLLVRDYFWPHARACLRQIGLSDHHKDARRVLRWIRSAAASEISVKDVRRDALAGSLDATQTETLLNNLAAAGWLRRLREPSRPQGGRPVLRWIVNPAIHRPLVPTGIGNTLAHAGSKPATTEESIGTKKERRALHLAILMRSISACVSAPWGRTSSSRMEKWWWLGNVVRVTGNPRARAALT